MGSHGDFPGRGEVWDVARHCRPAGPRWGADSSCPASQGGVGCAPGPGLSCLAPSVRGRLTPSDHMYTIAIKRRQPLFGRTSSQRSSTQARLLSCRAELRQATATGSAWIGDLGNGICMDRWTHSQKLSVQFEGLPDYFLALGEKSSVRIPNFAWGNELRAVPQLSVTRGTFSPGKIFGNLVVYFFKTCWVFVG